MSEEQTPRTASEVLFRELYREAGEILDRAEAMTQAMAAAEASLQRTAQGMSQSVAQSSHALFSSLQGRTDELRKIAEKIHAHSDAMHDLHLRMKWIALALVSLSGLLGGALAGFVIGMIWQ
jgi:hypothetical protein